MLSFIIDRLITKPIVNILFVIYNFIGDFGVAIILFTVIVKFCMWPLVKKQLHQTKLMRKLQPELAQIKKNCNGNRQLESLQTMDLYKKYNVKPFSSFLTLLIQFPIFIALFSAIRVMVTPQSNGADVASRAYSFIQPLDRISDVIEKQQVYLADTENNTYDFHPQLFGIINLDAYAGFTSASEVCVLIFAVISAFLQYWVTKQQQPSKQSEKKKSFRQLMKEAADGKEIDQAEVNNMTTGQMGKIMPIMMFIVMIRLPGALVFYYLLSNSITIIQQKIVFKKDENEMEIAADKTVLKELKKIQEAEIIENKKTGTKITRISAKDNKKKRR